MKNSFRYFLALLSISIGLQAEPIGLRIADSTFTEGDVVDIPVYVDSSLTGLDIYSYRLQLQFNGNKMQPISAHAAGTVSEDFGDPTINSGIPGNVILAGAGSTPLSGTGVLAIIRFELLRSGYTSLSFTDEDENYFNEGSPEIVFDDGSISINPLILPAISIYPNSKTMLVGDSLQFSVNGDTTGPFIWTVANENVASISGSGLLRAVDRGATSVKVTDAVGLADSTSGVIEVLNLTLSLPDVSVWQGDTVELPISYQELSEIDIYSGQFYLGYYSNRFEVVDVIQTGTLLENYPEVAFQNSVGRTDLAFAGNTPLPGSGVLMILRIHSLPENTSGSNITFNDVVFNENVPAQVDDGYLTVLTPPGLGITPTYSNPLIAGDTLRFSGVDGIPPYTYETSDSNVASIDGSGLLTALYGGMVSVTVADAFGSTHSSSTIQIYDTSVSFPDTSAVIGETFDMPIIIDQLPTGEMVNAIEATFSYRGPELEFIEIVNAETFTEGWTFTQILDGNTIQLAGAGANGFSLGGTILKLRFMLTDEYYVGESAYVRIEDLLLNEGTPSAQIRDGSIQGREQNDPPVITSPEQANAVEDEYFVYRATATDTEADPLSFTFSEMPDWLTAQADSIYGIPGEGVLESSFLLSVSDGEWFDTQTVLITVTPINDRPSITSPDYVMATEDVPFMYRATAVDPEDSTLSFSFGNLPSWLSTNADSITGIPLEGTQDTSFLVIVFDGELGDTLQVAVTVQAVNDPPEITSPELADAVEDEHFVYRATATDPEDSTMSFSFEDLPVWLSAAADSVFGIPLEGAQDTSFLAIVSDGELGDTLQVQITVSSTNDAPEMVLLSDTTMWEDDTLSIILHAFDVDSEILTFSAWSDTIAVNANIENDSVLVLRPQENWFGLAGIRVIVDDGILSDTSDFVLTVSSINDPPGDFGLSFPADSIYNSIDTSMVFGWTVAVDPDEDPVTYGVYFTTESYELMLSSESNSLEINIQELDLPRDEFITWTVFATDATDTTWSLQTWHFEVDATVGVAQTRQLPREFVLSQNYPNPFNPSTAIRFAVPEQAHLRLVIYDLMGRELVTLVNAEYMPGWHTLYWSGKTSNGVHAGSGIYLARLETAGHSQVIKMTLMK